MLIAIDHGNKQIKTNSRIFTSALHVSDTPPFGSNVLQFGNKYYSLSKQRIPYMRDKTADDRYFILSLFAIAFEMQRQGYKSGVVEDVQLAIGLPPAHYNTQYQKFENYFLNRGILDFYLDGKQYSIFISKARCYPQAYAATIPIQDKILRYPKSIIIDIGGFTADYLLVEYGAADLTVCDSLENGVITLYNRIKSKISADFDLLLDETDIDAVLQDKPNDYEEDIVRVIKEQAQLFIDDLFSRLRERMIDLRSGKTIFVGGGSILLRKQIEASGKIGVPIFVDDISANTNGYKRLFLAEEMMNNGTEE